MCSSYILLIGNIWEWGEKWKMDKESKGTYRLAATLSLGLLAVLGDVEDGAAVAGSHGQVLLSLRGGTSRLFALVPVRVRRLGVDGHLVGHAFGLALGDDSRAAASAPVILRKQNSVL